jgi:hypothetical protein
MCDTVYCEADLPAGHPESERTFQTKSLFPCLDELTITKEGRLILHACRYERAPDAAERLPLLVRVPEGDVDLEFHGDIRLTSTIESKLVEYAARFTHGTLEWIRPWLELTDIQRALLTP